MSRPVIFVHGLVPEPLGGIYGGFTAMQAAEDGAAMMEIQLSELQRQTFARDGFVEIGQVLDPSMVEKARARFEPLFAGVFETGLQPDEWNWRMGTGAPDVTRQICNGWKSDRTIAAIVLRADIGRACAQLRGWPGARINQDNVLWKPPGAKALGFHQDESYQNWITPAEMMTVWITLDDTSADGGTIEYVPGSHLWPLSPPIGQFHAPDDPLADLRAAAEAAGAGRPEIVPIEIPAGSAVIHHGRTWHGSRENRGAAPRRSVVAHCMSSAARFNDRHISPIYGRYRHHGSDMINESFFPILWTEDGARTRWLDQEPG